MLLLREVKLGSTARTTQVVLTGFLIVVKAVYQAFPHDINGNLPVCGSDLAFSMYHKSSNLAKLDEFAILLL